MTSPSDSFHFLTRLAEKHSRLSALAASSDRPDPAELVTELAALRAELDAADAELRARQEAPAVPAPEAAELFLGDDETMAMFRDFDWSNSPLGPVAGWSAPLRAAVRTVLAAKVPMLIWWGPQLIQLYNDAYRPLLGHKHPASIGQPAAECWAEVWDTLGPRAESVLAGEGTVYIENELLFVERIGYQEETYWTYSYSPITGESGEVLGVFVATTEVTGSDVFDRRMQTVRELGALSVTETAGMDTVYERALQVLAGNRISVPFTATYAVAEDGTARLQASYGISAAGAELPAEIQVSRNSPLGRVVHTGATEIVSLESFAPGVVPLPSPLGPAVPHMVRLQPVWLSGRPQPYAVMAIGCNPYRDFDQPYLRFLDLVARQLGIVLTDAAAYDTERQRAEALAQLDAAKTRFFENISHEFRTPLTLMMSPLDALLTDPAVSLPDGRRADIDAARRAVLRLSRLVDTLLEFAQAEADELHARLEPTDLALLCADVASMFRSVVEEEAGLALVVDTDSVTEPIAVDPEMVTKILSNLLANAIKFTRQGSIAVRLTESDDEVRLTVSDTGSGIPAEELPRIFERFYQAPIRGARSGEGAGIGLSLVSDLARAHGGEVSAVSEVGKGSEFTVRLPRTPIATTQPTVTAADSRAASAFIAEAHNWAANEHSPVAPEAVTQPDASGVAGSPAGRILLVEDNADMRAYLSRLLAADGWQVEATGSVDEALAASAVPDLVLSDVMLPGRSGIELVKLMRANPMLARIPAILLTARAGAASAAEGLQSGADDYVVKPFVPEELLARVRTHYELAKLREYALDQAENKAANLERALASNRQIGAAMGILMARLHLTDEQAFDLLRKTSQNRHRKLRDIAEEVMMTGELPA
ncbi:ATP-binding protein [Jatrophihabitans sp.]|uniref:ATP-binding protein n=1 Tax=Jatrophihabitans sp. TaxID=1932789 RepID=UPI002BFA62ED|nr:ATP-binding protein [Jatrophihabitans sp.]